MAPLAVVRVHVGALFERRIFVLKDMFGAVLVSVQGELSALV